MKTRRTYLVLGLILLVLFATAWLTPQQVNWTATYDRADKIPYGSYIVYERLGDIFPHGKLTTSNQPFYLLGDAFEDSGASCIIVTSGLSADELDIRSMAAFADHGNNVFISAYSLPRFLADTLGIVVKESMQLMAQDSDYTVRAGGSSTSDAYRFRHEDVTYWIDDADSSKQDPTITGLAQRRVVMRPRITLGTDGAGHPDFVKVPFGQGAFFIHVVPLAFTNYNMLRRNNNQYAAACLSHLSDGAIYWEEYYRPFHHEKASTPLRFILSVPAYKWAFYIALCTAVIYMVFAGRRLQRIIPTLIPPANTSLQFTQTIGTIYYQQRDHRDIAVKKMTYLLERIRQYYLLPTGDTSVAFRERLAYKSDVSIETVNAVFSIYENDIRRTRYINEETLIAFNTALEQFYNESGLINK